VLAERLRGPQRSAVEQGCGGREASLRARHPHRPAGERCVQLAGETVDDVALGHDTSVARVEGVYASTMSTTPRHTEPERSFGRDGISGLLDAHRAQRARDVGRADEDDQAAGEAAADAALARLDRSKR
jgi:hypothetical protein